MNKRGFILDLIRENKIFFSLFVLFVLVGVVVLSLIEQGDVIFYFSDNRSGFWDQFFLFFTKMGEEYVFILAFILLLFVRFRFAIFLPILGFSVTFTSFIAKKLFAHDRPYLYFRKIGVFDQINVVEGVALNGGTNSFPSGHTMAAFALFTFLALILPSKKGGAAVFFIVALLVGLSRIYLVQHFFKDIYLGAIIGAGLGILCYFLQQLMSKEPRHWGNKSLLQYPRGL